MPTNYEGKLKISHVNQLPSHLKLLRYLPARCQTALRFGKTSLTERYFRLYSHFFLYVQPYKSLARMQGWELWLFSSHTETTFIIKYPNA